MDVARPAGTDASEQLLEAMPDAIVVVDSDGRVARVNRQTESLSGYSREELLGMAIEELVPEALRSGHIAHRTAYQRAPVRRSMGTHLDIRFRRRDGSVFPADIALSPVLTERGVQVVAAVRDITERKRQDDRLRAVVEVAQAALEGQSEDDLLHLIARRARTLVDSVAAGVALLDAEGKTLTIAAADGPEVPVGRQLPLDGSLTARVLAGGESLVLAGGESLVLDDVAAVVPDRSALVGGGVGPVLVVLLASGQRTIGSLSTNRAPGGQRYTDADRELLELFAAQASVAIGYSRVRDELQRLAVMEDRERIGRELHDGAIQALFAVGMGLQSMALMTSDLALRERLETTVARIDDVIRDLRSYIFGLRPGLAADRHLARALRELAEELDQQHGVACAVEIDQALAARLAPRAADIVQVTREALSNVGRHAAATTCRLSLYADAGFAVLEVDDDGQGFTPGENRGVGWGMRNLGERATAMGGSLDVESVLGEGTTIRLRIPV